MIGKGCYRLLADNDAILNDIYDLLSNSEYRRNDVPENIDADIRILISNLKDLMSLLDIACSMMASQEKGNSIFKIYY